MKTSLAIVFFITLLASCAGQNKNTNPDKNFDTTKETPASYQWPVKKRTYWPTLDWEIGDMELNRIFRTPPSKNQE